MMLIGMLIMYLLTGIYIGLLALRHGRHTPVHRTARVLLFTAFWPWLLVDADLYAGEHRGPVPPWKRGS